ncbi:hypothetical protein SAMN05421833_1731 [Microbispora rosea]|uniref:Uncharacterized protein n=1 Tax=Microbispora rosea TaxID=58117 RepID=A0A1N7HKZ9_9ACTN|nr:hypothetical protein SAMN05421833_1731 [Microbispora rosea]
MPRGGKARGPAGRPSGQADVVAPPSRSAATVEAPNRRRATLNLFGARSVRRSVWPESVRAVSPWLMSSTGGHNHGAHATGTARSPAPAHGVHRPPAAPTTSRRGPTPTTGDTAGRPSRSGDERAAVVPLRAARGRPLGGVARLERVAGTRAAETRAAETRGAVARGAGTRNTGTRGAGSTGRLVNPSAASCRSRLTPTARTGQEGHVLGSAQAMLALTNRRTSAPLPSATCAWWCSGSNMTPQSASTLAPLSVRALADGMLPTCSSVDARTPPGARTRGNFHRGPHHPASP